MNRNVTVMLVALVAVFGAASMYGAAHAGSYGGLNGYLSDVMCATAGVSAGGFNLAESPEKHTVACMKMPPCEQSGYGIFLKDASGKYVFFKFDTKGAALAKQILDKTSKSDNMNIVVHGSISNGMVMVERIVEA